MGAAEVVAQKLRANDPLRTGHVIINAAAVGRAISVESRIQRCMDPGDTSVHAGGDARGVSAQARVCPAPTCRSKEQPIACDETSPATDACKGANLLGRREEAVGIGERTDERASTSRKIYAGAADVTLHAEQERGSD